MEARFGAEEALDLAGMQAGRIEAALADAAAEIDAALAAAYRLPLRGVSWPRLVGIACDLARRALYDDVSPAEVTARAERAQAALIRLAIDYTPDDAARDQVQGALGQVTGAFCYIEDSAEGRGRNIYAPRCSIHPAGGLTLLDGRSTEQQIRLAVSMLEPGGGQPALYIDGQAA